MMENIDHVKSYGKDSESGYLRHEIHLPNVQKPTKIGFIERNYTLQLFPYIMKNLAVYLLFIIIINLSLLLLLLLILICHHYYYKYY